MLSGGFDLKVMRVGPRGRGPARHRRRRAVHAACSAREVPVVVACTGHAVAAGALLLLGADDRVGARGAFRIGLIETQIGMVLPRWAVELAQERLSTRHFQHATVGARIYDPDGAVDAGFLDAVVDARRARRRRGAEARALGRAARARAYRGQVRMNRGERLGRLADAIAADRGRTFDVPA